MEKTFSSIIKQFCRKALRNTLRMRYDLFVSLGDGCATSQALRDLGLQTYSYPLDWLGSSRTAFRDIIFLLNTKFESMFDNLLECYQYQNHTVYCNSIGMQFNHDFQKNIPLEEQLDEVKSKYGRRITRLFDHINISKNVCFVYIEALFPKQKEKMSPTKTKILEYARTLQQMFSDKNTRLVYIKHNPNLLRDDLHFRYISNILEIIEINNSYIHEDYSWKGNYDTILKALSKYRR